MLAAPDGTGGTTGTGGSRLGPMTAADRVARPGPGGMAGSGGQGSVSALEVTTFVPGLEQPVGHRMASERDRAGHGTAGPTQCVSSTASTRSRSPINPTDLVANGEGGMLGLEVDPDFFHQRLCLRVHVLQCGPGVPMCVWCVFTLETPNGGGVVDRTDIVTGMPYSSGRHSGCRPRFGPDGYLWVGTGDAAIGTTPQDDDSLGGKVLRVDRNGAAAPGNPGGHRLVLERSSQYSGNGVPF